MAPARIISPTLDVRESAMAVALGFAARVSQYVAPACRAAHMPPGESDDGLSRYDDRAADAAMATAADAVDDACD